MAELSDNEFDDILQELKKTNPELDPDALAERLAQQDEELWQAGRQENYKKWVTRRVIMEIDKLRILRGEIPPELLERDGKLVVALKQEQENAKESDRVALRQATVRGIRQALAEFAAERDAYVKTLKTLLQSRDIDAAFLALKDIYPMMASDLDRILAKGAQQKESQA